MGLLRENIDLAGGSSSSYPGFNTSRSQHQDVVVFVSEFAGFLGVSLVTV